MSAREFLLPVTIRLPLRLGVGIYGLFILWASLRPAGTGGAIPHMDKVLHLLVYAVLAALVSLAWPRLSKINIFWICTVFGGLVELAQGFLTTDRTASLMDGLANSLGAAMGVFVASVLVTKFAR